MPLIKVRAVEGRVANTKPSGGQQIPNDRWINVQDSSWLRNLAERHGDIEIEPFESSLAETKQAPAKSRADKPST